MKVDPDKPGLLALLRGEGEGVMRVLAWAFVLLLAPLAIGGGAFCLAPYV